MTSRAQRRTVFERWAALVYARPWFVLAAWAIALVTAGAMAWKYGGEYGTTFRLPGSETQAAQAVLEARFPGQAGATADIVFRASAGVEAPETRDRIQALLDGTRQLPGVAAVTGPYDGRPGFAFPASAIGRAEVRFRDESDKVPAESIDALMAAVKDANGNGLVVEVGGEVVRFREQPRVGSEMIGLGVAAIVLLLAFGSVVAAGLPLLAAVGGLGIGVSVVTLATRAWDFPEFSPQFMGMIGIGVGIDYSLLVVTRFREARYSGRAPAEALALALDTSGRAVVFAGIVVAISFLGLFAMEIPFVAAMGTAGAIVVLIAVAAALSLVPALLALAGHWIDSLHMPFVGRGGTEGPNHRSTWYRFSEAIRRHPVPYFVGATAVLLILATPFLSMRLGFTDAGNRPTSSPTRRAYDLLAEGFGPGFNAPLLLVATIEGDSSAALAERVAAIAAEPGVASVGPIIPSPGGDAAVVTIIPATSPQAAETVDLVHRLRRDLLTDGEAAPGLRLYVTGLTAALVDSSHHIESRLPYLLVGVIGLSFILLMVVFRSIVVAVKAAIMNLLSIGASYGVLVAVFQWGWFKEVVGISEGPIEPFLPMMLFAILFGLSMDYEVFLISRIREEYLSLRENGQAVSRGLAATARVISAAAAIMVTVFLSFVLSPDRIVKEFGMGLATAIFVDATVVRLILVPATMEMLGEANWWFPRWLDRIVPNLHLEAPTEVLEPAAGASGE